MLVKDPFTKPLCVPGYLDRWVIRKAILSALKQNLQNFNGVLLDVGCGDKPYKKLLTTTPSQVIQYIGLDLQENPIHDNCPDITWKGKRIPLEDNSIDCAIATEVLEHCPNPDAILREVWRVLKHDGLLFITVPFLWPLHETPYDEYRYTPYSLTRHLDNAGFKDISLTPMGGWDSSLSQMLGLWIRRRPMNKILREVLSILFLPLICLLAKSESKKMVKLQEGLMITGIAGTAIK